MDNSWIKLYRKILHNDELFRTRNTFTVLCWLLLLVDRTTGKTKIGRLQGSKWLKIPPSSFYRALKKLESMEIIEQQTNNKWTMVTINKWFIYQSKLISQEYKVDSNRTALGKEVDTPIYTRRKKKEYIYNIYFIKFLEIFNSLYKSSFKPTKKLNELYNLRRKTFESNEIIEALNGMHSTPFYKGNNDTGWKPTPEFILRNDEKMDEFLNMKKKPKPEVEYEIDEAGLARIKKMKDEAGI